MAFACPAPPRRPWHASSRAAGRRCSRGTAQPTCGVLARGRSRRCQPRCRPKNRETRLQCRPLVGAAHVPSHRNVLPAFNGRLCRLRARATVAISWPRRRASRGHSKAGCMEQGPCGDRVVDRRAQRHWYRRSQWTCADKGRFDIMCPNELDEGHGQPGPGKATRPCRLTAGIVCQGARTPVSSSNLRLPLEKQ